MLTYRYYRGLRHSWSDIMRNKLFAVFIIALVTLVFVPILSLANSTVTAQQPEVQQWEYLTFSVMTGAMEGEVFMVGTELLDDSMGMSAFLEEKGLEGWEFVGALDSMTFLMKRPIE
jgi:hypothetical protein